RGVDPRQLQIQASIRPWNGGEGAARGTAAAWGLTDCCETAECIAVTRRIPIRWSQGNEQLLEADRRSSGDPQGEGRGNEGPRQDCGRAGPDVRYRRAGAV